MGQDSAIQWTDHTFNPWRGCQKVSAGCAHCYAEKQSKRNPRSLGVWGAEGVRVVAAESYWVQPVKWEKEAKQAGVRRRVFFASMADVFEDYRGLLHDTKGESLWIDPTDPHHTFSHSNPSPLAPRPSSRPLTLNDVRRRLFKLITATPDLDWLLLTKRPENIDHFTRQAIDTSDDPEYDFNAAGDPNGLDVAPFGELFPNVWLGTSAEDQPNWDKRVGELLKIPAEVTFVSAEPLLGRIGLNGMRPDWVIIGGESGPQARECQIGWIGRLAAECITHHIPLFVKQFVAGPMDGATPMGIKDRKGGDMAEWPEHLRVRQFPIPEPSPLASSPRPSPLAPQP